MNTRDDPKGDRRDETMIRELLLRTDQLSVEPAPELIERVRARLNSRTCKLPGALDGDAAKRAPLTYLVYSLATWRRIMRSPVSRIAAAVVFILTVTGVALWFHSVGTTPAFADFTKPFLDAKSAKYKVTATREGRLLSTDERMVLCPYRTREETRTEMPGGGEMRTVTIWDFQKGKMISLDPGRKTAMVTTYANMPKERASMDPFAEWRSLLLDARLAGSQTCPVGREGD